MSKYVRKLKDYGDILHLPHPVSKVHPRMSAADRAAQFSPFAALTGYEEVIRETSRLTSQRREPNEDKRELLEYRLHMLETDPFRRAEISVTYFVPDKKKEGGEYREVRGRIKKIDRILCSLVLEDLTLIPIKDIVELEGAVFDLVTGCESI